jgi:ornithine cyclodeaminase
MITISEELLREVVPMKAAINAVRNTFASAVFGDFWQPPRIVSPDGRTLAMLASDGRAGTTAKIVSVRDGNPANGLPTIMATVVWIDFETGALHAIIDGAALTALRTGATTGLATDLLAPKGPTVLTMLGAGRQAAAQIEAVAAVRNVTRINIVSRSAKSAERLAADIDRSHTEVTTATFASVRAALADATVVCCATPSREPLFETPWLSKDVHINAIGSYQPGMCELAPSLFADARLVTVEQKAAAFAEAGDLIRAIGTGDLLEDNVVELRELIATPFEREGGVTIFKSVGLAIEDWAVAQVAYDAVRAKRDELDVQTGTDRVRKEGGSVPT